MFDVSTGRSGWASLLTLAAFFTYFAVFVWFPVTRDFPWANLLIFLIAVDCCCSLAFAAVLHPTARIRRFRRLFHRLLRLLSSTCLCVFRFCGFYCRTVAAGFDGAPQVGQKAPDFTLTDTTGRQVSLNELLTTPINGTAPKGVLLVFYRGYW